VKGNRQHLLKVERGDLQIREGGKEKIRGHLQENQGDNLNMFEGVELEKNSKGGGEGEGTENKGRSIKKKVWPQKNPIQKGEKSHGLEVQKKKEKKNRSLLSVGGDTKLKKKK